MSELNSVRMTNFVKQNRDTMRAISQAVQTLAVHCPTALKQLAYVVKNPDAITDIPTYVTATQGDTAALIAAFRDVQVFVDAYEQVRDTPADVDTVLSTNGLDISSMSIDLVKG